MLLAVKVTAAFDALTRPERVKVFILNDGTTKIFLNMDSKNGSQELISLLQYMKDTTLENPDILVKDDRIIELDRIVNEVKESEEWEEVQMTLLEIGIEKGREEGIAEGMAEAVMDFLEEMDSVPAKVRETIFAERDLNILRKWHKLAVKAETLEEFLEKM